MLVLVCFLALLFLFFYKNLEANLKGFYANRNFPGEIKITGFSWAEKERALMLILLILKKLTARIFLCP